MSPSIREGDAWPTVVMADLEEGEFEEGELPVTQPEVRQPSRSCLELRCHGALYYRILVITPPLVCMPTLIWNLYCVCLQASQELQFIPLSPSPGLEENVLSLTLAQRLQQAQKQIHFSHRPTDTGQNANSFSSRVKSTNGAYHTNSKGTPVATEAPCQQQRLSTHPPTLRPEKRTHRDRCCATNAEALINHLQKLLSTTCTLSPKCRRISHKNYSSAPC